jgi:hypothetical protein
MGSKKPDPNKPYVRTKFLKYKNRKGEWRKTGVPEEVLRSVKVPNGTKKKWVHWFRTDTEDKRQVCGAKLRGIEGRRCGTFVKLYPNGRCHRHSGPSSAGAIVVARAMRAVGPLKEARERAEADAKLLDLRPGVALFDQRMEELSTRMFEEGDSPAWRKMLMRAFKNMVRARQAGDEAAQIESENQIKQMLTEGVDSDRAWEEILALQERRAKRAESAGKILVQSNQVVATRELMMIMDRFVRVIEEEVPSASRTRVLDRVDQEVLDIIPKEAGEAENSRHPLLPRVPGEGAGVRDGGAGGEALGVPEGRGEGGVRAPEGDGADVSRPGKDADSGGGGADVPVYEERRGGHHDGADGPPGSEPPVGGDRSDARERDPGSPGEA